MRGVSHYKSAAGFHCIRVHYTADPVKDPETPEGRIWIDNEVRGIPGGFNSAQWQMEYEVDWSAAGGDLVYPQLRLYESRIVVPPFTVPETWSLFGAFDYGFRNPSSFHIYALDHDSDIWAIWEYYRSGQGYRKIAQSLRACPYWDRMSYLPVADPSIWAKTQNSESGGEMKSIAQLFFELPPDEQIIFAPAKKGGDITIAEKINGNLWNEEMLRNGGTPRLRIFSTCPMLVQEMKNLRFADWSGTMQAQRNLQESIVDKDNHSHDELKYFMTMFFMSPDRPEAEPMEKLKKEDPTSYAEWMAVRKMHGEEQSSKGTLGEFE